MNQVLKRNPVIFWRHANSNRVSLIIRLNSLNKIILRDFKIKTMKKNRESGKGSKEYQKLN